MRAGLKYGSEHVSCEQSHGASGSDKQCESLLLMTVDLLFTLIDLSAVLTENLFFFFLHWFCWLVKSVRTISEHSVILVRWGPQKTPTQPPSLFRFTSTSCHTSRLQSSFIPQTIRLYDRLFMMMMMMMMPWCLKLFTCPVPQQQPLKVVRSWKKNTQLLITEWVC